MSEPRTIYERFSRSKEDSPSRVNLEAFEQEKNILQINRDNFLQLKSLSPSFSEVDKRRGIFEASRTENVYTPVLVEYDPSVEAYGYFVPKTVFSLEASFDLANAAITPAKMTFTNVSKTPALIDDVYNFDGLGDNMSLSLDDPISIPTNDMTYGFLLSSYDADVATPAMLFRLFGDDGSFSEARIQYRENDGTILLYTKQDGTVTGETVVVSPTEAPLAVAIGFTGTHVSYYLNSVVASATHTFSKSALTGTVDVHILGDLTGILSQAGTLVDFIIQNEEPDSAVPKMFYHWTLRHGLRVG